MKPRVELCFFLLAALSIPISCGPVHAVTYDLTYRGSTKGSVYPGGTFTMVNIFTNTGDVDLLIEGLEISTSFGMFAPPSGLPFQLSPRQQHELDFEITVPSSLSAARYSISSSTSFQYLSPDSSQWVTPDKSPLVVSSTIMVGGGYPFSPLTVALGTFAAILAIGFLGFMMRGRRRSVRLRRFR